MARTKNKSQEVHPGVSCTWRLLSLVGVPRATHRRPRRRSRKRPAPPEYPEELRTRDPWPMYELSEPNWHTKLEEPVFLSLA
eukprot:1429244-Pyramimonas_sp.AAC.1